MKLIISLFMTFNAMASVVTINTPTEYLNHAAHIKKYLVTKYHVPKELVHIVNTNRCEIRDERFLELCLTKKGELKVLSSNHVSAIETLKVFSKPHGGQL